MTKTVVVDLEQKKERLVELFGRGFVKRLDIHVDKFLGSNPDIKITEENHESILDAIISPVLKVECVLDYVYYLLYKNGIKFDCKK